MSKQKVQSGVQMSKQRKRNEAQMSNQAMQNKAQVSKQESYSKTPTKKKFALPPNFALRTGLMCIGILLMGLTLSVLMKLNLGTDPYSCFVKGFSGQVGISYGNAQLLVQLVLFVFVVLFARNLIGIGMIANMVFLGYITDFGTYVLDSFVEQSAWKIAAVRYGLLIPVLAVFIFGAALYMAVDLGMSPYDGMPFLITDFLNFLLRKQDEAGRRGNLNDVQLKVEDRSSKTGATGQAETSVEKGRKREVPFRVVRMVWDFIFMTLGYFLGGIFGAVTVLQMLFLGTAISWVRKKIEPLLGEKTV